MSDMLTKVVETEGDMLLIPHGGTLEILVSSETMLRVSPVFRQMLEGTFIEADLFKKSRLTNTSMRLKLYETHPEGMLLLCQLLHVPRFLRRYTIEQTMQIALLTDKYDCSGALQACVPRMIAYHLEPKIMDTYRALLTICYLFRHALMFAEVSKGVILGEEGRFSSIYRDAMIPASAITVFVERREEAKTSIYTDVVNVISKETELMHPQRTVRPSFLNKALALDAMRAKGLWPFPWDECVDMLLGRLPCWFFYESNSILRKEAPQLARNAGASAIRGDPYDVCLDCLCHKAHTLTPGCHDNDGLEGKAGGI